MVPVLDGVVTSERVPVATMTQLEHHRLTTRVRLLLAALAALAGLAVIATLDAFGEYPALGEGPGLTNDEIFNVNEGYRLCRATGPWMAGALDWRDVFGEEVHLSDHPPLGRYALGLAHETVRSLATPAGEDTFPLTLTAARTGSAIAFALLVYLVGRTAAGWYGPVCGGLAAMSLVLMPRVFAHAHLASLETMIGLAYAATVLSLATSWTRPDGPRPRDAIVPGVLLGLALLTKIQAVLLVPPVIVWALWHFRRRGVLPLLAWGGIGLAVFFVGWPWLWLDPVNHLGEYFARTTQRASLSVWYFSEKYPDLEVPWHYPLVLFAVTVPVGLQLLAGCGLFSKTWRWWHDPRAVLLVACLAFPVLLFCLPGVAVYDGTRLFLVAFPLWAIVAGRGSLVAWSWLRRRLSVRLAGGLLAVLFTIQAWGLIGLHPCQLGFYNLLVGGPAGAERLGLEPTYWGDSLTRGFLERVVQQVPADQTIAVFPSLYPHQWDAYRHAPVWGNNSRKLPLLGTPDAQDAGYLMIFRRKADLPDFLRSDPPGSQRLVTLTRGGVVLAVLYRWSAAAGQ